MSKSLLFGIVGLLVGVAIGAGTMHWIDTRKADNRSADAPTQPKQDKLASDPVIQALDAHAFVKRIIGDKVKFVGDKSYLNDFHSSAGKSNGVAVWHDEPLDNMVLREKVVAAIKTAIAAGGAEEVQPTANVSVIQIRSHKVYDFSCPYLYSVKGGATELKWARVWLTAPVEGTQYSVCYVFGWQ